MPTLCHHVVMDTADLDSAAQRFHDAEKALDSARAELRIAVIRALENGVRQVDVVHRTGWTREYLRRLRKKDEEARAKAKAEGTPTGSAE